MKNIKNYENFINEMRRPKASALEKAVNRIVSTKNGFDRSYLKYTREELVSSLIHRADASHDMGLKDLLSLPKIENIDDRFLSIIYELTGATGKSPNKKFVKKFAGAVRKFPDVKYMDPDEIFSNAVIIKQSYDTGLYPSSYRLFTSSDRRELESMIKSQDLLDTLNDNEIKFLKKTIKKKYESLFDNYLNNKYLKTVIHFEMKKYLDKKSEGLKLLDVNLENDTPEFFQYLREKYYENEYINWDTLSVELEYKRSDNSAVVSSSFTTYYYYDIVIKIDGKTFKYNDVNIGTNRYSGGWS